MVYINDENKDNDINEEIIHRLTLALLNINILYDPFVKSVGFLVYFL